MPSAATLRTIEKACERLSWLSFGVGVAIVLALCARALLGRVSPSPEEFLVDLGVVLGLSLVPTFAFRLVATGCRRLRAGRRPEPAGILDSVNPFEDSITR